MHGAAHPNRLFGNDRARASLLMNHDDLIGANLLAAAEHGQAQAQNWGSRAGLVELVERRTRCDGWRAKSGERARLRCESSVGMTMRED